MNRNDLDFVKHMLRDQLRLHVERDGDQLVLGLYFRDDVDGSSYGLRIPEAYLFDEHRVSIWQDNDR